MKSAQQCVVQLEKLLHGDNHATLEIKRSKTTTRDIVLEHLQHLVMNCYPQCKLHGEFVDEYDCITYDLHIETPSLSSIRIIDLGDCFKLLKL